MKYYFTLLVLAKCAALVNSTACNANNCARAVIGTAKGLDVQASHKADCSSFFKATVTPATSTVTVFATRVASTFVQIQTTTTQTTIITTSPIQPAIAPRQVTVIPSQVPVYASACAGASAYSSACSCFGVTPTTVTLASPITTLTITLTTTTSTTTLTTATRNFTSVIPTCAPGDTACASGSVCINGACIKTCSNGSGCNSFPCDSPTGSCLCISSSGGMNYCGTGTGTCNDQRCTVSEQCAREFICDVNNCCGVGICSPVSGACGNPAVNVLRRFKTKQVVRTEDDRPLHI